MTRKYAQDTSVPVGRTQASLRDLVKKKGASGFAFGEDNGRAVVQFALMDRMLSINVGEDIHPKEERRLWRALFMSIKAKLVIAEEGIETFDEVFLANIVMPNGQTYGEFATPQVSAMVESGKMPKLLPSGLD